MPARLRDVRWFLVFHGLADAYLWEFDADDWHMLMGDPAMGRLGIAPSAGHSPATLVDAWWLADACAYDHDAPVGLWPAWDGDIPKDPDATPFAAPIEPFPRLQTRWYWENLSTGFGAIAENRFQASYVLRYEDDGLSPSTDFSRRFAGREDRLSLYAMATRQLDVLSEFLCLYRILEAADGLNGMAFAAHALPQLFEHDFGALWVVVNDDDARERWSNAFEVLRDRATTRVVEIGVDDVPSRLYSIRNSLAHGKQSPLAGAHGPGFAEAVAAVPIVKLLARLAVEG